MELGYLFTDHMVLQREKPIRIYGTADTAVTVKFDEAELTVRPDCGKWCAEFPPMEAGGPHKIEIIGDCETVELYDVMVGEVFLAAGQSNMAHLTFGTIGGFEKARGYYNSDIRLFTVPHRSDGGSYQFEWQFERVSTSKTAWRICAEEAALHFSAIGFFFADMLHEKLNIPIGIINCSWGGTRIETWIDGDILRNHPEFTQLFDAEKSLPKDYEKRYAEFRKSFDRACLAVDAVDRVRKIGVAEFLHNEGLRWPKGAGYGPHDPNWPGVLHKYMLSHITGYPLRAVLWYQGESNIGNYRKYGELFSLMLENWRSLWQDDIPFYTVQIAPFLRNDFENWVGMMNEQRIIAEKSERVFMVTTTDIGVRDMIHPPEKSIVAEKLCNAVLKHEFVYDTEYCGPIFEGASYAEGQILLTFSHAEGGLFCDGEVSQLEAAFADGEFHPVKGIINGSTLSIYENAERIRFVRMGYADYTVINLCNKENYPASPFAADVH